MKPNIKKYAAAIRAAEAEKNTPIASPVVHSSYAPVAGASPPASSVVSPVVSIATPVIQELLRSQQQGSAQAILVAHEGLKSLQEQLKQEQLRRVEQQLESEKRHQEQQRIIERLEYDRRLLQEQLRGEQEKLTQEYQLFLKEKEAFISERIQLSQEIAFRDLSLREMQAKNAAQEQLIIEITQLKEQMQNECERLSEYVEELIKKESGVLPQVTAQQEVPDPVEQPPLVDAEEETSEPTAGDQSEEPGGEPHPAVEPLLLHPPFPAEAVDDVDWYNVELAGKDKE